MEEEQSDDIAQQPQATHYDDDFRITDFRRRDDPAQRFQGDAYTKSHEEDSVDESTKDFRPLPTV